MKNDCVFCAIAAGEIPSFKVYEDDDTLADLDVNPFAKGHVLVIPKAHSSCILDTPDETLSKLVLKVRDVAAKAKAALGCDGFNILQHHGESAGQTVKPLPFHLVPRYGAGPVDFESHKADMEELKALAEKIAAV